MPEPNTSDQGQGPAGGGTQTSGQPSQNTNPGTQGQPQSTTQPSTTTGTGQAPPPEFKYSEDRSKWIPPHRLSEVSTRATQAETRAAELQRQVQALTSTVPKDEQAQKAEVIQEQFYKMFPWAKSFKDLSDDQIQKLLDTPTQVESANQFVNQGWERHAKQMTGTLIDDVSQVLGGKLDADSQSDLKIAFGSFIQREVQKAEKTGEIGADLQKYIDGDESVVKDFAKKWTDRWFTPARRQVTSQEVNRSKRVPNSSGRSQQTQVERPQKFNTIEDRLNFLADKAKEEGVRFEK